MSKSDNGQVTLRFQGAARTVTGSSMVLSTPETRVMIDCGMFQGSRSLEQLNYAPFDFDPSEIDALILTHAHIDHCGLIPKLVKGGFSGPVWCTQATRDLLEFTLPDAGRIQEYNAERKSRSNARRDLPPVEPLYEEADAHAALKLCREVDYKAWFDPAKGVKARFWNAGHILGSGSAQVETGDISLLFSGDLGPDEKAFHPDPEAPTGFDYVISESTYGSRDKKDITLDQRREILEKEVEDALARGGNLVIPAFAIERTQELLLDLALLMNRGLLKRTQIFLDSPLASKATGVFFKHRHMLEGLGDGAIFRHPAIHYVETREQSMAVNRMSGVIIIAASGMCEGGRIRHHLRHNLWRRDSTVLFVGYQAKGTLGRVLMDGAPRVRMSGQEIDVNARIRRIDNYSAHADQTELANWIAARMPVNGNIFLTHGEEDSMEALIGVLAGRGIGAGPGARQVIAARLGETYALAKGQPAQLLSAAREDAAEVVGEDWQNAYAAIVVDLKKQLRQIKTEEQRRNALARMRDVLDSYKDARG